MIRAALFSMLFGAVGAVAIQGVVWRAIPQPPRFGQVDLVAIMEGEVEGMARRKMGGEDIDAEGRARLIQDAVAAVAQESGRVLIARQALVAGAVADVPDMTERVRERLRK